LRHGDSHSGRRDRGDRRSRAPKRQRECRTPAKRVETADDTTKVDAPLAKVQKDRKKTRIKTPFVEVRRDRQGSSAE
jgi:hypothetical protein